MEGVRRSREVGGLVRADGVGLDFGRKGSEEKRVREGGEEWRWDWDTRRGRKAWVRVKGARRWVFRTSDQVEGVSEGMGAMGNVEGKGGRRIREARCRGCGTRREVDVGLVSRCARFSIVEVGCR